MICRACGDPAAHPVTGAVYGQDFLVCHACEKRFWEWAKSHTNKKAARKKRRDGTEKPSTALSFYEHAGRKP